MTIRQALSRISSIHFADEPSPALHTVGDELAQVTGAAVHAGGPIPQVSLDPGAFCVLADVQELPTEVTRQSANVALGDEAVFLLLRPDGAGVLAATHVHLLFSFLTHLLRDLVDDNIDRIRDGRVFPASFSWHRSTYDYFLNQEGRIQMGFNRDSYVRRLAESGFTHVEVNGLAFPQGLESGPAGEAYPMFYTYCPALDQFVDSDLNKGLYPADYLSANLRYLKRNASLARQYGLVPGLLCFEPRSVPDQFFDRYPMLRGARVDHPFRSFKPRYNMTIAHPAVRHHYAEMVRKLMKEVPELGFLSIWSNDSGAGFEHTQSLYVGRNGGAYLIREWKDETEIARAAADNAIRFLGVLRNVAREINPDFRVITRLEPFYGEHDALWEGLCDGLDVETTSLVARGWEMPYAHPRYSDSKSLVGGSVYQQSFAERETELAAELDERSSHAHFYFAAGPNTVFAPLLGIPYPTLTQQRLSMLHKNGVRHLAHLGGSCPPELVPYDVNHEILRIFQFDPEMDLKQTLLRVARTWVGERFAGPLQEAWMYGEEAILAFPHVTPLYSTFGFVWYRLWTRPLVPNIEAIPVDQRAYYQNHMCTTPHNPNNIDLSRDVLFQLTTVDDCRKALARMDANVWGPLDAAITLLQGVRDQARETLGENNAIEDTCVRLSALRCWLVTQRSLAAWIVGVCGYMQASSDADKQNCRSLVDEMIDKELENTQQLLSLLDSGVQFMATTDQEETPLIHSCNLKDSLTKRMALMIAHRGDEPFIDPDYTEREAAKPQRELA